mmetsp:Transcript_49334/g.127262  ORF Transcript_49334/g.127262 Transcript_49334/m.127262 type:complete len:731 (-) Transcript_49334:91-2283(-)
MVRRPPTNPSSNVGRLGTVINSELQDAAPDEETLREENSHLRAVLVALRREGSDMRERLTNAEEKSNSKDKRLQELLTCAKGGSGVSGEVLDQLREDLQLLLQVKKRNQEARLHLEDKEQKLAAIQHELKVTDAASMHEDVRAAKDEAKAKAKKYAEMSGGQGGPAKKLLDAIADIESAVTKVQREIASLEDKYDDMRDEEGRQDNQITLLRNKRQEVQKQAEQWRMAVERLDDLTDQHEQLTCEVQEKSEKVKQLRSQGQAERPAPSAQSSSSGCKVNEQLLTKAYHPVSGGEDARANALLWQFRRALEAAGSSGIDILNTQDSDSDGRLTATELSNALNRLHVPDASREAVEAMLRVLDPALVTNKTIAIVELVLSLPLVQPPPGPTDAQLSDALEKLAWSFELRHHALRKTSASQGTLRGRLAGLLAESGGGIPQAAVKLCEELGLPELGATLGQALEARGEAVVAFLPSWRSLSGMGRLSLLLRFVREVAAHRDRFTARLASESLELHVFLKVRELLGSHWSDDDLRQVALLSQPVAAAGAPVVDAARLARAANPGGLKREFEQVFRGLENESPDIGRILDDALSGKEAKGPPGLGWLSEAVMACEAAATGNTRKAAPADVERVVSSSRPAGGPAVVTQPAPPVPAPVAAAPAPAPAPAPASAPAPAVPAAAATPSPNTLARPTSARSARSGRSARSAQSEGGGYSDAGFEDEVDEDENTDWEDEN